MRIDPSRAQPHDIQMTVKPTVTLVAADGRRLHPEAGLAALATRPYRPLAERLATSPAAFEGTLPSMRDGLRYARALALVSACLRAGQQIDNLVLAVAGTLAEHRIRLQADSPLRPPGWTEQLLGPTGTGTQLVADKLAATTDRNGAARLQIAKLPPLAAPSDLGRNVLLPWLDVFQAEHPGIDKISFTGSTQIGRSILQGSAGNMKKKELLHRKNKPS